MWNTNLLKSGTAAAVVAACLSAPVWAVDAAAAAPVPTEPAVWTQKEVQFTYMGFTTHYTCDGLRDTVREMLVQLGARKSDLKVYEQPCSRPDRPDPFPGVKITMSVLQPAPATPNGDSPVVEGYWKPIKLPFRATNLDAAGQCELLEQFKQQVLPLFTTRNVDLHAGCVPHQLEPLGTALKAEVLFTDQKKAPPRVSQSPGETPPAAR